MNVERMSFPSSTTPNALAISLSGSESSLTLSPFDDLNFEIALQLSGEMPITFPPNSSMRNEKSSPSSVHPGVFAFG